MRAVVQRVTSASVEVDGDVISSIGKGLLCLVGLAASDGDGAEAAEYMCRKILRARLWPSEDSSKAWDRSVVDIGGEVLLVSQFTLYGRLNGNRLDFSQAMRPQQAAPLWESFVVRVGSEYIADRVKDGRFGAFMEVALVNDGPVTISLDSSR